MLKSSVYISWFFIVFIYLLACIIFFVTIPANINENALLGGYTEDFIRIHKEISSERNQTLIFLIPNFVLTISLIIYKFNKKNILFWWTFLAQLSIIQAFASYLFFNIENNTSTFFKPLIICIFICLLIGQIISALNIYKENIIRKQKNIIN